MAVNPLDRLFGTRQTTTTRQQSDPWAPTQGLLNGFIGSIGTQFGGGGGSLGGGGATGSWGGAVPASLPRSKQNLLAPSGGTPLNVGLTGTESGALDTLAGRAEDYGRYAPDLRLLAVDLLRGGVDRTGMVTDALNTYRAGMMPYASMSTNPFDDPNFNKALGYIKADALDTVKSAAAGAGYSLAGLGDAGAQVAEGTTRAIMPFVQQRQRELEGQQISALQGIYGAGNTTAGLLQGMDQTALANRQAGIGVGQAALSAEDAASMRMLELEAKRRGIPLQNLTALSSLIVPMAQLGGTKDSTSTTQTQVPIGQQLLNLGFAGAGLISGMGGFGGASGLLGGLGLLGASGPLGGAIGSNVNTGVMGGGYLGAGGQVYPGPGYYR